MQFTCCVTLANTVLPKIDCPQRGSNTGMTAGVRGIANLGNGTVVNFLGARLRVAVHRRQRCRPVKLTFRPINAVLQHLHQAIILKFAMKLCLKDFALSL